MKKATIKRRKRVVPALQDSSSVVNLSPTNPSAIPFATPQHVRGPLPPPAVDFTGYNSFQRAPAPPQISQSQQPQPDRQRRKRSVSSMSQASETSVNVPVNHDSPVDPSLLALSQKAHHKQSQNQNRSAEGQLAEPSESRKAERRAQLVREAEQMRELLIAKERELAELG